MLRINLLPIGIDSCHLGHSLDASMRMLAVVWVPSLGMLGIDVQLSVWPHIGHGRGLAKTGDDQDLPRQSIQHHTLPTTSASPANFLNFFFNISISSLISPILWANTCGPGPLDDCDSPSIPSDPPVMKP